LRLLALDTTTPHGSVALLEDEDVRAERRATTDSHSQWLSGAVADLLTEAGWAPGTLEGFAAAAGPGSFTGLRVGLATVQGLALATRRPCLGVSSLEALALSVRGQSPTIVSLIDAFRQEVFFARFDREGRPTSEAAVGALDRALDGLSGEITFVGEMAERAASAIRARHPAASVVSGERFLARAVGRLALVRFRAGEGRPPRELRPLYVRGADIRKPAS
jgi:tRNA threonylcarbamoyladenosine biosynthesis protein TsaB